MPRHPSTRGTIPELLARRFDLATLLAEIEKASHDAVAAGRRSGKTRLMLFYADPDSKRRIALDMARIDRELKRRGYDK